MSTAVPASHAEALERLRSNHINRYPRSRAAMAAAEAWLPGGNTRSVLHYDPFPLVMVKGDGAYLHDLDGHRLLDCVGEFSAGLYGHSDTTITAAIRRALSDGLVLGAPNSLEVRLAEAVCRRFPSVERVRFCNSGTEANILAAVTARAVTGRPAIMVFDGAYHGGVMSFGGGGNPMNAPFEWIVLPYNDPQAVRDMLRRDGQRTAAVFVEPVLGAAGNIPGTVEFLATLREETAACGTLLIFDEVKTSRLGRAGVQGLHSITPDLTTFGKYLGGGLPLGAFGGRADIMDRFDPRRPDALKHAGTFNNNICSMAAGLAGLEEVFTPDRADAFLTESEGFRQHLAESLGATGKPVTVTGLGSLISLHVGETAPQRASDVDPRTAAMRGTLHMFALQGGVALTGRGDMFLSLPMTKEDLRIISDVVGGFTNIYGNLYTT